LADRLLEVTGTVEKRLMKPQYLDQLELERERGITIKMAPVRMNYESRITNQEYVLNLIDTPGHSDFAYEVSRALAAVEGAVLLVDATQGIQAQTLANFESAKKAGLKIIGAVNKIDAAQSEQIENAAMDLAELIGVKIEDILKVSGKTGEGVETLLEAVIEKVPAPAEIPNKFQNPNDQNFKTIGRALIFDSLYDEHKGVMAFVRVFDGEFKINDDIELLATKTKAKAKEIGTFSPQLKPGTILKTGEIGYIATGIKDADKLKIGDTLIGNWKLEIGNYQALPGYAEPKPVVFVSFYPAESDQYDEFKLALSKLRLTDSSLTFEPDSSEVLGRGFKGGFLGRLHFEIAAERLAREFKIETVHSFPSVAYKVDGKIITNPKDFPNDYNTAEEPMTKTEIVTPPQFLGAILRLQEIFRFSDVQTDTLKNKVIIRAKLPLADLIRDLDDKLKSVSQGFASFYYELTGFEKADVSKLEILVAGNIVPGLTRILPKEDIEREARTTVEKLKDLLPKQQFVQAIQAMAGGRIIARETIPAMKKLLGSFGKTGGDRTRKMKLWKKQQRGKERLKERGESSQIKIPANIFKELLKK
jgi:GTP-binding protein LepA